MIADFPPNLTHLHAASVVSDGWELVPVDGFAEDDLSW
jgi:hypothetical protein